MFESMNRMDVRKKHARKIIENMSICKLEAGEETVITIHVVIGNVEKNLPLSKSAAKAGATDMPAATTAAPNALGTLNLKPAATAYKRRRKMAKRTVLDM